MLRMQTTGCRRRWIWSWRPPVCAPAIDDWRGNVSVGTGDSIKKRGCEDVGQVARGGFCSCFQGRERPGLWEGDSRGKDW